MAHSKRELPTGRAHTKVAGDDEMLRTGFYDGTPLEGGKIADSQPVDLFAAARRVAESPEDSQQQRRHKEQDDVEGEGGNKNVNNNPAAAAAATEQQPGPRQGVAEPERATAGGRRLGLGRPGF